MSFNNSQKEAITHNQGPMMVLAGPGSGKTLVITQRTKYLIEQQGVNPGNILVITFTKAAAMEMKGRFEKLMDGMRAAVTFGTFHSVFFHILKHAYRFSSGNILPEEKRMEFIRNIVGGMKLEIEDEADFLSGISGEIGFVKGEMLDLNLYYSKNCSEENFRYIYGEYEKFLQNGGYIDFEDMLVMCYQLFRERKDILTAWQQKFRYILIDEFQDINLVQYQVIRMLAGPENNLFIVGDDDQSIYRFRGAKPEIMLGFEKDYPTAKKVLLDVNYRCTQGIVDSALRVIHNNKLRFPKEITAANALRQGVTIREFPDQKAENEQIAAQIKEWAKNGVPYSDIAVLFRTNTGPRLLVEKLMEYNLPFKMKDSLPNLFDHWIAKNIISYIRIALGGRDRSDFLQIINRPKRYIARDCFPDVEVSLLKVRQVYQGKDWMQDRIDQLEEDLKMLSGLSPFAAVTYIRNVVGYEAFLREYAAYRRMKFEELAEVLDELSESAKAFSTYDAWFAHMQEYGAELKRQAKERSRDFDGVCLSTMHSSKGLEYRYVIIIDANEGITPYQKAVLPADIEEERRLFYVAMTRAKEYLFLYSVRERYSKKMEVSRFIGECLTDAAALQKGAKITHKKYGIGVIRQRSDNKIIVRFDTSGKEVVLDVTYCVAQRMLEIEGAAR